MIKKNNLTMKKLQEQINTLQSSKGGIAKSGTNGLMKWFAITAIISYANKIPFIAKWTKRLGLWYGKTSWWVLLVNIRKAFIVFNAIIGLYASLKLVGFSSNNVIGGFMALGVNYLEMLSFGLGSIFKWIYNLFDNEVVPKPSGSNFNPSNWLSSDQVINTPRKPYYKAYDKLEPSWMHDQLYGPSYNWDAYPKQRDGWFTHSWYWYVG